jgi:hypothetical protein
METHLGTNLVTWLAIFPVLIIVAVGIIWYLLKARGSPVKRIALIAGGIFAFIGFTVILLGVYYHLNPTFAIAFQFYTYSNLAPKADPFLQSDGYAGNILMMREVLNNDGRITLLSHPNQESPIEVSIFTPGRYIQGQLLNDVLTIPQDSEGSLPRVMKTSLWWALTKDLYTMTGSAN